MGNYRIVFVEFWLLTMVSSSAQPGIVLNGTKCERSISYTTLSFQCPDGSTMEELDIEGLTENVLDMITELQVLGTGGRGPLSSIPANICRLKELRILNLHRNRIRKAIFSNSSSCLPRLEVLTLGDNFLSEVPVQWIAQMPQLKILDLSQNSLSCLPYKMFHNVSNIDNIYASYNQITSIELWLMQVKKDIHFLGNPLTRFTNNDNVDLSSLQSVVTANIDVRVIETRIEFDDGILEMFNRCGETNSSSGSNFLMQAIQKIHASNQNLLNWKCDCDQYHLREYIISSDLSNTFSNWSCPGDQGILFGEKCTYRSSINGTNIKPRFCKINSTDPGDVPIRVLANPCELDLPNSSDDLEFLSATLYDKLVPLDPNKTHAITNFAEIIDRSNAKLESLASKPINRSIQANFQKIISRIEEFIEAINTPTNITSDSVSILTVSKNSSIYSYSQIRYSNPPLYYSTDTNLENYAVSITIDPISIMNLSETDLYTFYFLPSSLFRYAQEDQQTIIVSPIVGVHLINRIPHLIRMSFIGIPLELGEYSCAFWRDNQWNKSGCNHSFGSRTTDHFCSCNHTTSFALIFIPQKTIRGTYLPTIIIAILSIVCFCISIILSIHRQATSFRYLSIANIFTLLNSLVFFILLTVLLIVGYRAPNDKTVNPERCYTSLQNLTTATYFFLLATFASRTLLGIYYFLTIFFHWIFIQFTSRSNRWFYAGFLVVILIAMIPTIVISIVARNWTDLFERNQGVCWFHHSFVFRVVSIPIIIFVSLNILFVAGVTIRLVQFCRGRTTARTNDRRLTISIMIWVALCVLLGIGWIFGPMLNVLIADKNHSSSIVIHWIFALFTALEGVWMLIVNVVFYVHQRMNIKNPNMTEYNANKYQF